MSFQPFFGGKRICIGKTFAESVGKCVIPIIVSQVRFEFPEGSSLFEKRPINGLHTKDPEYMVIVNRSN